MCLLRAGQNKFLAVPPPPFFFHDGRAGRVKVRSDCVLLSVGHNLSVFAWFMHCSLIDL